MMMHLVLPDLVAEEEFFLHLDCHLLLGLLDVAVHNLTFLDALVVDVRESVGEHNMVGICT
jgi:hypothetical protein